VGVTLINTDGMAFIGPGSEWFWTALSGIVLAITFIAIYRQLRLQRSQAAIEGLNKIEQEYSSERLVRHALELCLAQRAGADPADLPQHAASPILNYWERVGSLARHGHLDLDLLWEGGSGFYCQSDWVRLAPTIRKGRGEAHNPQLAEHFEWLADAMAAKAQRLGVELDDPARQAARLDQSIATCQATIRTEESLRTVMVGSPGRRKTASRPTTVTAEG
jgi:hypothetical protein